MKRSSFLAFAVAACLAASSAIVAVAGAVAHAAVAVFHYVERHIAAACSLANPEVSMKHEAKRLMVKAVAFAGTLAKRDRPVLTSSWRMCPSA